MNSKGLIQVYTGNGKGKTTAALGLAVRARAVGKRVAIVFFDKGGEHYSERKLLSSFGVEWFGYGMDRIDPKTERFRFGVIPDDISQAEQGIAKARELLRNQETVVPEPVEGTGHPFDPADRHPPRSGRITFYDLLVLDEINTAVALGMIPESAVEQLIEMKPPEMELVLTGRTEVSKPVPSPSQRETNVSLSSEISNLKSMVGVGGGAQLPGKPWPDGNERQRWLSYFDRADLLTEMRLVRHYFYRGTPAREGIDY